MTGGLVALVVADLLAAVVLVWTTTAAAAGRIRVNALVGIRTASTMASERAWRAGHRAALPLVRVLAAGFVLGAVVGAVLGLAGVVEVGVWVALAPVVLLAALLVPLVLRSGAAAEAAHSAGAGDEPSPGHGR